MVTVDSLVRRFEDAFNTRQARVLAEAIHDAYSDLVKTSDFNELKAIVKDLAEAQNRTEARLGELTVAQQGTEEQLKTLAAAQQGTEEQLKTLAAAQQGTEEQLKTLTVAQERLTQAQQGTEEQLKTLAAAQQGTESSLKELTLTVRNLVQVTQNNGQEIGGLSRNASYALENEAYRLLPALLQERYGIHLVERIIRAEIEGEEINFLARGQRNGQSVCLVGEAKLRLDERRDNYREVAHVLNQLEVKVTAVQKRYPDCEIVRLLVTHFARPAFLEQAGLQDVIVVQSFEW